MVKIIRFIKKHLIYLFFGVLISSLFGFSDWEYWLLIVFFSFTIAIHDEEVKKENG